ncbi:expressed unknown protein [Seminavis robusta]|uniref:Uncharacterized protein n=1 Tax=Seminavis robusta TaxID=568900 RepID=A0A9N8EMV0_9STRA|nr:expressed unknown protein [Seminavis robusta]|eukprot:Sro1193_g251140.1 n/a (103) ;mRNA; r:5780-6088
MTIVQGKKALPAATIHDKCMGDFKSVEKKKKIDLEATGDKKTNALLALLKCQVKASSQCKPQEKEYTLCHQSFMGVGSYKGQKHCGGPMEAMYNCIRDGGAS